jgi:hypothetical protein
MLVAQPSRTLTVSVSVVAAAGGGLRVDLRGAGVDRADVYLDGRPLASADLIDGAASVTVDSPAGTRRVRAQGFAGGVLVVTADREMPSCVR